MFLDRLCSVKNRHFTGITPINWLKIIVWGYNSYEVIISECINLCTQFLLFSRKSAEMIKKVKKVKKKKKMKKSKYH